jgi:hypothetical protein
MQQYLRFPQLKTLELSSVILCPEISDEGDEDYELTTTNRLPDATFFQGIPNLEYLFLKDMPLNATLPVVLQDSPSLQHLVIDYCSLKAFISPFIGCLADIRAFPALKHLTIDYSWPRESNDGYKVFAQLCTSHRPNMEVVGNRECYRKPPNSDRY